MAFASILLLSKILDQGILEKKISPGEPGEKYVDGLVSTGK